MIPMSHLSFVQCEQLKFRPKKNDVMKVLHSVVGRGWGRGNSCHVTHDTDFCNVFNLLSFTIPNKA